MPARLIPPNPMAGTSRFLLPRLQGPGSQAGEPYARQRVQGAWSAGTQDSEHHDRHAHGQGEALQDQMRERLICQVRLLFDDNCDSACSKWMPHILRPRITPYPSIREQQNDSIASIDSICSTRSHVQSTSSRNSRNRSSSFFYSMHRVAGPLSGVRAPGEHHPSLRLGPQGPAAAVADPCRRSPPGECSSRGKGAHSSRQGAVGGRTPGSEVGSYGAASA